jgi:hypothetical protein
MSRIVYGLLITLIVSSITPGNAQSSADEAQIKRVIETLFRGMLNSDSALVRSSFAKEVRLATIYRNKSNTPSIRHENSIKQFLEAVGKPHPQPWHEEVWGFKILVDGDLASAWCDYAFYLGNKFSHCGVDAFLLHKTPEGWKIFQLADTRRTEGCGIPDDIRKKHE